jgi:hypothetical protein
MYHCHVQSHSDMGMVGLFLVRRTDGTIPGYEPHTPHGEQRAGGADVADGADEADEAAGSGGSHHH